MSTPDADTLARAYRNVAAALEQVREAVDTLNPHREPEYPGKIRDYLVILTSAEGDLRSMELFLRADQDTLRLEKKLAQTG